MEVQSSETGTSLFGLSIDINSSGVLKTAALWGRILSITGFILSLLLFILGIFLYNKFTLRADYRSIGSARGALGTTYLIVFLLYGFVFIISSIFVLNFSNKISEAIESNSQDALNAGFNSIKNALVFWAIVFLVITLMALISFLGMI
jgi:hypothetical protein